MEKNKLPPFNFYTTQTPSEHVYSGDFRTSLHLALNRGFARLWSLEAHEDTVCEGMRQDMSLQWQMQKENGEEEQRRDGFQEGPIFALIIMWPQWASI